ncbi:DUF2917 domain-containing protein [Paenacidovorax monticola]|uniref:DUF2917 domain-containing protein n=1 Tax=Paenacidovorax monticola TaxID=1926868 RepID=A0A7H0HDZ7_9BURK|nr:DUF2917 domain-containing protein [Paenacidovorax monticola]QNP58763.1 DUF2917 domain-containing protein [Paenacidovorax monticola]
MSSAHVLESQQSTVASTAVRGRPGCWKLDAGRTLALRPRQRSVLAVEQGRVWVTQTQTGAQGAREADCFLGPGERWEAAPGRLVVLEPVGPGQAVAFRWDPVVPAAPVRVDWEGAVLQPLRDLAQAVHDTARAVRGVGMAVARLAGGALRWVLQWPAGADGAAG